MNPLLTALLGVAGLIVGDSLEVVVERLGAHGSLDRPWSACPSCGAPAKGMGLVPVLRVLVRTKGCPSCGASCQHPWRPPVMAAVCAGTLCAFAVRFGADAALAPYSILAVSLVAITFVDLERFLIPNRIVYPTLALVAPLLVVASAADDRWGSLWRAAVAGAVSFVAFFVVHAVVPRGMGYGDVRLAGLLGLATGWLGLGHAFVAFLASFVAGSVIGLVVMAATGGGRKTKIPFGPFLALGAVFAVIWGNPVVHTLFHRS